MNGNEVADEDLVLFSGRPDLTPGDVELHFLHKKGPGLFGRKLDDLKADFAKVARQVSELVDAGTSSVPKSLGLESVTVSLGFSAKGQLVFIAEAGAEASVSVTFTRSDT